MNNKILISLQIILLFSFIDVFSQSQFKLEIGGNADDEVKCIINTFDNGFAVAGLTRNIGAGNSDVYVIKFNEVGEIEWSFTAGGSNNDIAQSIVQTQDSGYLIGAESRSFFSSGTDIYIIRLTKTGTVVWEKIITGFAAGSQSIDFLNSVVELADNGFMVSATTTNVDAGIGGIQIFRLNSDGAIMWNKVYTNFARRMIKTSDGGFALTGSSSGKVYALKLDSNGNFQWNTAVGGVPQDVSNSIVQTSDGGFVMAGETISYGSASGNMYIVKLDSLGNLSWTRHVGRTSGRSAATEIIQTYDGGYAVAGHSNSFGNQGRYNVYLVKLNADGEFEWNRSVGTNEQNEFGNSIIQTPDSGFIIGGYISTGFGTNIYIIKFDKEGNTCMDQTSPSSINGTGGVVITPSPNLLFPGYLIDEPNSFISSGVFSMQKCILLNTPAQSVIIPDEYLLEQNYPNPFNPITKIKFSVPLESFISLKVYETSGKEIAVLVNGIKQRGFHEVDFEAGNLASGIYFYTLRNEELSITKKMILMK